ncbi:MULTISPECIES: class E sortase [unclassified Streptomyces]|uniref:class E sortase n=1 Tax=unclassified Streptomyces TaxID=2593676 RepID=UPI001660A147|nr:MULTISPECIES: class E sortase [unclassified Streptomyces]MBD0708339.1 class E sortase [Streptomyces sp. CBMA291]MBD0717395.1 class E sortase [Streptomyces sp. CBMA370]
MRLVVRTLSELCLTVGTLTVLFVVYVLHWTGIQARDAGAGRIDTLQREWAAASTTARTGPEGSPGPAAGPGPLPYVPGEGLAVMYVPRLGADWKWPVLEGTGPSVLREGLGHYAATARLGATGNFSVAGHRRTHGDPFKDFPRLRPGDAVVLTDGTTWFTYRVDRGPYRTVPTDVGVVAPLPRKSGYAGPGRYLTLTTCDPEWGSSHRLVVWAHLDSTAPAADGLPPALAG